MLSIQGCFLCRSRLHDSTVQHKADTVLLLFWLWRCLALLALQLGGGKSRHSTRVGTKNACQMQGATAPDLASGGASPVGDLALGHPPC